MSQTLRKKIHLGMALFIAGISANAHSAVSACNRELLKSVVEVYFDALESRNPSSLRLSETAKFTENGRVLPIGGGLWETAGKALLKRSAIDTTACSTHTQAVIEEAGRPIIYGVRLKLDQERISEIETFVAREKEFAFNPKGLLDTRHQDWESILPLDQRSSRLAMIAAADDYFNMFVKTPKVRVPFANPCDRWENGTLTTVKTSKVSVIPGTLEHDCSPKGLVTPHHKSRRFLVDVEAGVVVAYVLFSSNLPDFHMFKMRNGKVELIQAVIGANNGTMGWPDAPGWEQ